MMHEKISSMEEIANTHTQRIEDALQHLHNVFPLTEISVQNLNHDQILHIEMLTSRFAKLQDYLGANVFDLFFEVEQEIVDSFTMIDKLNRLEQLRILPDTHVWRDMRRARNIVAHEYPDNPLLMATTLNQVYNFCPILIEIKNKIFTKIKQDEGT